MKRFPTMFPRAIRAILILSLVVLAWACLSITAMADAPDLSRINEAIKHKGLDWKTQDYGRTFATGALIESTKEKVPLPDHSLRLQALPSQIDWRDHNGNWVSPVKDQGYCGSCWSFAGVAAVESLHAIWQDTPGVFLDLSEQLLLSCCSGDCGGGYVSEAAAFLLEQGTCLETCFPYAGDTRPCSNACTDWQGTAIKIAEYHSVSSSIEAIKEALQDGPVQVSYIVTEDFYCYAEGVYEYPGIDPIIGGHAVLAVGYVDTPGIHGGGHFIIKNSWGPNWGENGFFRIGYSQLADPTIEFGKTVYRYVMESPPADAYEPDDTSTQAVTLAPWTPQTHNIRPAGDIDWATFVLSEPKDISLFTSGDLAGDPRMWLYTANLELIEFDDDGGEGYHAAIARTLPPGQYLVKIDCFWDDRIIEDYDLTLTYPQEAQQVSIDLNSGWQLVSVPLAPTNTAVDAVLESISGQYGIVMAYDLPSDSWLVYDPADPAQATLTGIDEGTGLWIEVLEPTTLVVNGTLPTSTAQTLSEGWNLVAYPSLTPRPVAEALASIESHYDQVIAFAPLVQDEWKRYNASGPDWANTLATLTWGNAYWVHVTSDCTLTIEN